MDMQQYLLPELDETHPQYSLQYKRFRANHYDTQAMERAAAAATGVSYYRIIESETLDMLPEEWRTPLLAARTHNATLDAALPSMPHHLESARPYTTEWELRDGTDE